MHAIEHPSRGVAAEIDVIGRCPVTRAVTTRCRRRRTALLLSALLALLVPWAQAASADVLPVPVPWIQNTRMSLGLLVADATGDGKADLIAYGAEVMVARSTGAGFEPPMRWLGLPNCGPGTRICQAADVNGDGKADLIGYVWGAQVAPGWANVYVALSTGSAFLPPTLWNDGFCIEEQTCQVADVTGDGKADLVAYTPLTGLVWVSPSTGSSFGPNAVRHPFFCIRGEICLLGDVEGDGRADLVLFKPRAPGIQKGNVLISSATASGFGPVRYGHGYFCIDSEACFVADMNGDHRDDVVLSKPWPTGDGFEIMVSLSNGSQFINGPSLTWLNTKIKASHPLIGDVTGDGKEDLVFYWNGNGDGLLTAHVSTTDPNAQPKPTNPPPSPVGVASVHLFNCTVEQRPLTLWLTDFTTGRTDPVATLESAYDAAGNCPGSGVEPTDVNVTSVGLHQLIAVDPPALTCGADDPNILGCRRDALTFQGNPSGSVWNVVLPTR